MRLLQEVREDDDRWAWPDFFLTGAADTANQTFAAAIQIVDLFKEDRERIMTESDGAASALRIRDLFQQNPFIRQIRSFDDRSLRTHHQRGTH